MDFEKPEFEVLVVIRLDLTGASRLPAMLGEAGCRVTLFSPLGRAINQSRFIRQHIPASSTTELFIAELREHLAEHRKRYDWIIIAEEPLLLELSKYQCHDWLDGWFPVNHRSNSIKRITSKFALMQAAADIGLPVPAYKICHNLSEVQQAAAFFGYPVILKLAQGMNASGVRRLNNPTDLVRVYQDFAANQISAVQEFIQGKVGITEVLFDHGKPLCWYSSYLTEHWPTPLSASCARQVMDHPEIESLIEGVGACTGFHGLAGVEWIHKPASNKLLLMEFNPRPTPGLHISKHAGVNFACSVRQMLNGLYLDKPSLEAQRPLPESTGRKVVMFPQGLYRAVDSRNPLMLLQTLMDFPTTDPRLGIALLRRVGSHFLPRTARDKGRGLWRKLHRSVEA